MVGQWDLTAGLCGVQDLLGDSRVGGYKVQGLRGFEAFGCAIATLNPKRLNPKP